jgi:uncharacterized protein YggE
MAAKNRGRAGDFPPARPHTEAPAKQVDSNSGAEILEEQNTSGEDTNVMPSYGTRTQTQIEGITVIGEAVRRITSENAEFLIEVTSTAPTAAQALRDNQAKITQVTQAVGQLGVQPVDVQAISLKVQSLYSPVMQALPGYGGLPQIGQAGLSPYGTGAALQPEIQFGSYVASNTLRLVVREAGRVGDVADIIVRTGATLAGPLRFRAADEPNARRAALEAAAKDAKMKAEALATASGKKVGDPIAISEDIVASNGMYGAARSMAPFAFGAGAPEFIGELEYYARVSASFRFV